MPEQISDEALEYTRNLYRLVLDWYKNADSKAQILLTIDGAFVAFLTGSIFSNPDNMRDIICTFEPETWILLMLMCLCLVGSIISALNCLKSRTYSTDALTKMFKKLEKEEQFDMNKADTYGPEVMGFFQIISVLNVAQFSEKLRKIEREFIINTHGKQIHILSGNVHEKHYWVNIGFLLAGMTLIFFLSSGISYLIRVYFSSTP